MIKISWQFEKKKQMDFNSILPPRLTFSFTNQGEIVDLLSWFSEGDRGGAGMRLRCLLPCLRPAVILVPVTASYWRIHHARDSQGGFFSASWGGVAGAVEVNKLDWLPSEDRVRASVLIMLAGPPGCLIHSDKSPEKTGRVRSPYAHLVV